MLDVHAPEHPILTKREFFVHLFTITCGLLIALGLENTAEALHHRHQRIEAEETIRHEIELNRDMVMKGEPALKTELGNTMKLLVAFEAIADKKADLKQGKINFEFRDETLNDGAWRSATSTGVLSYMDYAEVARFADAYKETEMLEKAEAEVLEDFLLMTPYVSSQGTPVSADKAKEALPYIRRAVAHLDGVMAVGAGSLESYNKALDTK